MLKGNPHNVHEVCQSFTFELETTRVVTGRKIIENKKQTNKQTNQAYFVESGQETQETSKGKLQHVVVNGKEHLKLTDESHLARPPASHHHKGPQLMLKVVNVAVESM